MLLNISPPEFCFPQYLRKSWGFKAVRSNCLPIRFVKTTCSVMRDMVFTDIAAFILSVLWSVGISHDV